MSDKLNLTAVLNGLGQSVLIFGADNRLLQANLQAASLLGTDLSLIRERGWSALVELFDADLSDPKHRLDAVRQRALTSERPVRFHIMRNGEYVPCSASVITADEGQLYTLVTLEPSDWSIVTEVMNRFRKEMRDALESTTGHIALITKTLYGKDDDVAAQRLAKRIGGFAHLIAVHMKRAERLMDLLTRLEDVRTGRIRQIVQQERRKIDLADFMEDFIEALDDGSLLDPETEQQEARLRVKVSVPDGLYAYAVRSYLTICLRELIRNAMMYSLRGTPINIRIVARQNNIQIEVTDEGYGVRESDWGRVFKAFERARQPQIISEFGYGLALHLCKHEVETMNGRLWFSSQENVGTTFSVMLPMWRDISSSSPSP